MAKEGRDGSGPMTMEDLAALAGVSKITVSRALREADLNVPADVAVTGYDDAAREPHLTSVRQDWNLIGTVAAEMMFDVLAGHKVASRKLPVELIVRASTQG